ncbi:MAG: TolC family protein, partial [Thermoanaerobaculia bacterium]
MRRFLAAVVFAVVLSPAQAQEIEPARELTLQEALRNALAHNPGAAISRSDVEAAERRVRLARSSILPQIYLDGRYTRNDREVIFDFDGTQVPILPENDW